MLDMKYIDTLSLCKLPKLELQQLVRDLKRMSLWQLMEFCKPWNSEIICQFYATYYLDISNHSIHWTTEGKHYKLDSVTFSRLLGFGKEVRKLPRILDFDQLEMTEYQYMYLDGHKADGKSTWLKPYYYVLNNILR
jgi:hypothetical protein